MAREWFKKEGIAEGEYLLYKFYEYSTEGKILHGVVGSVAALGALSVVANYAPVSTLEGPVSVLHDMYAQNISSAFSSVFGDGSAIDPMSFTLSAVLGIFAVAAVYKNLRIPIVGGAWHMKNGKEDSGYDDGVAF